MSTSTIPKGNASQRVIPTSASSSQYPSSSPFRSSTQYRSSSPYRSSTQYQSSSVRQSSNVHQSSNVQQPPSSQTTNYFGPVRSSVGHSRPQTFTTSYNQQRASPYNINSPRTNRRQGDMSRHDVNIESADFDDDDTRPSQFVTVHRDVIHMLVQRCDNLEGEMQVLQRKTDKLLKIALNSVKEQEDFPTTKPKSKVTPVLWNDVNLLEKPRTTLPTTYLCHLVRKIYTAEEIKNKVPQMEPQEGDERLDKIKECLVQLYFSHDPSVIDDFMRTRGHTSLSNQERTKRSRDKTRLPAAENNNNHSMNANGNKINVDSDSEASDDD